MDILLRTSIQIYTHFSYLKYTSILYSMLWWRAHTKRRTNRFWTNKKPISNVSLEYMHIRNNSYTRVCVDTLSVHIWQSDPLSMLLIRLASGQLYMQSKKNSRQLKSGCISQPANGIEFESCAYSLVGVTTIYIYIYGRVDSRWKHHPTSYSREQWWCNLLYLSSWRHRWRFYSLGMCWVF